MPRKFSSSETRRELRTTREARRRDSDVDMLAILDDERPKTRGDCKDAARPCPFVGCRHHLATSVDVYGTLHVHHDVERLDLAPATCSLDVADDGIERDQHRVAFYMGVANDTVNRIEESASHTARRMLRGHR